MKLCIGKFEGRDSTNWGVEHRGSDYRRSLAPACPTRPPGLKPRVNDHELRDPEGPLFHGDSLRRVFHAFIGIAAVFLFLGATPTPDARFRDLGHRMMCTCGCAQILLECNHVGCQSSTKMINQLQTALDKGDNDDLILQGFVQNYGPTVIAAPTATGFNRVAWIMPFAVLALGIAFAVHTVRTWKNRPEPALADGIVIPPGHELDDFRARARKETDL